MAEEHHEPSFSSPDAVEVVEYPRISRLAVAALLLGLLSVAALTSQVLWCLPAAGVIAAVVALQLIARAEAKTLGRRAAVIGLALSLTFVVWAPLRHYIRVQILSKQAREHAVAWITYVQQGRLHEAHQLRLEQYSRQSPSVDLEEFYENNEITRIEFKEFTRAPFIRKIFAAGDAVQPRYVRDVSITSERSVGARLDVVIQLFLLGSNEPGTPEAESLVVEMVRQRPYRGGEDFWYVRNAEDPDEPLESSAAKKRPVVLERPFE